MYCIFTDRNVPEREGNYEHIFPHALGGKNEFVVWSDKEYNSDIGSRVDGALANDFLIMFPRRDSGVRGYSNKPPEPRWRNVNMENYPHMLQVTWGKERISVWDARQRRELEEGEVLGNTIQAKLTISWGSDIQFVVKVALAGGYFIYGNDFVDAVDCNELRSMVSLDLKKARSNKEFMDKKITVCNRFHKDAEYTGLAGIYRALCEEFNRSLFIVTPSNESISFHVGVLGTYIGSINVPATTSQLPIDGEHDLGHTIILGPGSMERMSFRSFVEEFRQAFQTRTQNLG